jgi:hypothetical protein
VDADEQDSDQDGQQAANERSAEARIGRLRDALLAVDPPVLDRHLKRLPDHLRAAVAKAARVPPAALRAGRNPSAHLHRIREAAVLHELASIVSEDCFEATCAALGAAVDDPTVNQLRAAIDAVQSDFSEAEIRLVLAVVAASDAPASDACDVILDEDPPPSAAGDSAG